MEKKKDERGSIKVKLDVYRQIAQFAGAEGVSIGGVIEEAWREYKENHGVVIRPVEFHEINPRKPKLLRGA